MIKKQMTLWCSTSAANELCKLTCHVSIGSIQQQVSLPAILAIVNPAARDIFLNANLIVPFPDLHPLQDTL